MLPTARPLRKLHKACITKVLFNTVVYCVIDLFHFILAAIHFSKYIVHLTVCSFVCFSNHSGVLKLMEYGEEYVFTLPSAYARSILTVPWVELGGKVNITCAKTGYAATVTFHTKPFYGGKVHR